MGRFIPGTAVTLEGFRGRIRQAFLLPGPGFTSTTPTHVRAHRDQGQDMRLAGRDENAGGPFARMVGDVQAIILRKASRLYFLSIIFCVRSTVVQPEPSAGQLLRMTLAVALPTRKLVASDSWEMERVKTRV